MSLLHHLQNGRRSQPVLGLQLIKVPLHILIVFYTLQNKDKENHLAMLEHPTWLCSWLPPCARRVWMRRMSAAPATSPGQHHTRVARVAVILHKQATI